jgi:hypothetical protein
MGDEFALEPFVVLGWEEGRRRRRRKWTKTEQNGRKLCGQKYRKMA